LRDPFFPFSFIDDSGEGTRLKEWVSLICEAAEVGIFISTCLASPLECFEVPLFSRPCPKLCHI